MRLTPHAKDSFKYVAAGVALLITGVSLLSAVALGRMRGSDIRAQLNERTQSAAAALGSAKVATLAGAPSDAETQNYRDLKATLAAIKKSNPDARSVYLMGTHGSRLFFYVDSEQPDSSQYSPAGDWYDDGTAADHAVFTNGRPFVEGPAHDSYGTFISGIAPIAAPGSSQVIAVLGMDVDASAYWRDIIYAASVPLLAGLSVVLVIIGFESVRRRNMQLLAMRSELVSVASHELRNPITGIRWAADSLSKMTTSDAASRMARAIYASAVRLQSSTDDILELSHAMNRRTLTMTQTDIVALIREVVEVQALSAQQKGISIDIDASWPATLVVSCDADQIKRALHNVVSNAIKYGRDMSTVTIAYKVEDGMHAILVTNEGIGIPEAEQSKVWRGFYRASNAVSSNIPGTGLGLYLVKAVFERHGGHVTFTSVENQTTTFVMTLPVKK